MVVFTWCCQIFLEARPRVISRVEITHTHTQIIRKCWYWLISLNCKAKTKCRSFIWISYAFCVRVNTQSSRETHFIKNTDHSVLRTWRLNDCGFWPLLLLPVLCWCLDVTWCLRLTAFSFYQINSEIKSAMLDQNKMFHQQRSTTNEI